MQQKELILPPKSVILSLDKNFKPTSSRSWARDIKKLYGNSCVISNATSKESSLVSHHLFSKKDSAHLEFSLLNGLPLATKFHLDFHKKFGQKTTPTSFIQYLDILLRCDPALNKINLYNLINWVKFLDQNLNNY